MKTRAFLCSILSAIALSGCVSSDPADQTMEEENLRDAPDQSGAQSEDMGMDQDVSEPLDMANLPVDMSEDQSETPDLSMPEDMGESPDDMGSTPEDMTAGEEMDMAQVEPDMSEDMGTTPMPNKCRTTPDQDGDRAVIISRPYDANGGQQDSYELLMLSTQGILTETGERFDMGRSSSGVIQFTPDGKIGVVRQEDGSLGIFSVDAGTRTVSVIDPAFKGLQAKIDPSQERYFSTVSMAPDGSGIFVTNASWRNVGGSVWFIPLDCSTGFPGQEVQIAESKLARHLDTLPNDNATLVVASHDILTTMTKNDAHLVDISTPTTPSLIGSGRVFMDDDAIIMAMGISHDSKYVLLADSNISSSANNNRVGVFEVGAQTLTAVQTVGNVFDPASIQVSPYNNAAIVTSFEGNQIIKLDYDPTQTTAPFIKNGTVSTTTSTLLPSDTVMLNRGTLRGAVLVVENTGIRTLQFTSSGQVTEVANYAFGEGIDAIVGAIGVQP